MNTEMVLDVNQGASDVLKEYEEGGIEFSKFLQMLEMLNSFSDVIRSLKLSENVNFIYRKEDIPKLISDERFLSIEPLKRDIENLLKIHSDKVFNSFFKIKVFHLHYKVYMCSAFSCRKIIPYPHARTCKEILKGRIIVFSIRGFR